MAGVGFGGNMVFVHECRRSIHSIGPGALKEIQRHIPSLRDAIWNYWSEHLTVRAWHEIQLHTSLVSASNATQVQTSPA